MHTNPEVLALLALGEQTAATPSDREHIAGCEACSAEVNELAHLAGVGRSVDAQVRIETPSPDVWRRIATELNLSDAGSTATANASVEPVTHAGAPAHDRPTSATSPPPVTSPGPSRGRRILTLALAAVLALVVGVGAGIAWERFRTPAETVVAQAALEALPDWAGATGQATLETDSAGNRALVVRMVTPRPVDGIQQVWLIDRSVQKMYNIGPLTEPVKRFELPQNLDVAEFPIVDVSEEPANDGDVAHSGNSIVRGTLDV